MATHVYYEYSSSPLKPASSPAVRRNIQPSPEKRPHSTALVLPFQQSGKAQDASPKRKRQRLTSQHEFSLGSDPTPSAITNASNIDLSFPMVEDGGGRGPTNKDQWKETTSLFPTTQEVWINSPFLVICVQTLPPRPWPLTIGGYPLQITTDRRE